MHTQGGFLISQIKQIQGRLFQRLLDEAGIDAFNGAQGRILYVLWQEDPLPIVEIAARTGLAQTTLTGMLDRMQGQGHIQRLANPEDRRQVRIALTPAARALQADYDRVSEDMNCLFYQGFTEEEVRDLEDGLRRVLGNLKKREEGL